MGSRYLTDLADVCRRSGWPVIEVDDWPYRARGSGGYDSGRPNHVMAHHTASGAGMDGWGDVNYCTFDHQDAPLCNLYIDRSGTIFVCAGGATNTNGSGSDPCGVTSNDSMNSSAIGIEVGNNGVGEQWPEAQQDSYVVLCKTLCDSYGLPYSRVHAHFEWAPSRKIDPAGNSRYATGGASWNMDQFRNDVTAGQAGPGPGPQPPQPQPQPPQPSGFPPFPGTGDYGAPSNVVREWQDAFIINGVISDNSANRDGVWGNGMHNACLEMQRDDFGWSDADGIGGPHTWNHLRAWKEQPCPTCGKSNY